MLWQSSVSSSSSTMVWSWRIMHGVEALRRLDMVLTGDAAFFWMDHWPRSLPAFLQWWCERGRDLLRASVTLEFEAWMKAGPLRWLWGEAASAGRSQQEEPVAKIPEKQPFPWGVISGWRAVEGERVPEKYRRLDSLTVSAAVLADLLQLHDRKLPGDTVEGGGREKTISVKFHQILLSYSRLVLSQVFFKQSLFHGLLVFSIYVPEHSGICTHESQQEKS